MSYPNIDSTKFLSDVAKAAQNRLAGAAAAKGIQVSDEGALMRLAQVFARDFTDALDQLVADYERAERGGTLACLMDPNQTTDQFGKPIQDDDRR